MDPTVHKIKWPSLACSGPSPLGLCGPATPVVLNSCSPGLFAFPGPLLSFQTHWRQRLLQNLLLPRPSVLAGASWARARWEQPCV